MPCPLHLLPPAPFAEVPWPPAPDPQAVLPAPDSEQVTPAPDPYYHATTNLHGQKSRQEKDILQSEDGEEGWRSQQGGGRNKGGSWQEGWGREQGERWQQV